MPSLSSLRVLVADSESAVERTLVDAFNKGLSEKGIFECVAFGLHEEVVLPQQCSVDDLCGLLKESARRHKCHVIVIDKALLNKMKSESWRKLSTELSPIQCVLHVGDSIRTLDVVHAIRAGLLISPIKRRAPSHKPLDLITDQAVWQRRARSLSITPSDLLSEIASELSQANNIAVTELEVQELFEYLFPEADSVSLVIIPVGLLASVPRGHSVLLQITEQDRERQVRLPVVLKIASREKIEEEVKNYRNHIKGHLKGMRHTYLERYDLRWEIGGIVYSLLGADTGLLKPLADHYEEYIAGQEDKDDERKDQAYINRLLGEIFDGVWSKHYIESRKRSSGKLSLPVLYNNVWRMNGWLEGLSDLASRWNDFRLPDEFSAMTNPFEWVSQNKERLSPRNSYVAITHGDLHLRNVLVDDKSNCWLIDFERTGYGPILQDFTEFHFNVLTRYRLVNSFEDEIPLLYDLYIAITAPDLPQDEIPLPLSFLQFDTTNPFRKTLATSHFLHDLSRRVIPYTDSREYLWGLLLNALSSNTRELPADANESDKEARRRSLLLASVICGRLDRWRDADHPPKLWPPSDWPSVELIDERNPPTLLVAFVPDLPTLGIELTDLRNPQREFKVRVLGGADQHPNVSSKLPYDEDELVALMKLLEFGGFQPTEFDPTQNTALKQMNLLLEDNSVAPDWCDRIGHDLFDAIVPTHGGVRTEFENAFYKDRKGGELQLIFDNDATDLACQPWELLHDGFPNEPRTPIDVVRYIASGKTAQSLGVSEAPCQILYMIARPNGYAQAAHDRDAIKASVASSASPGRFEFEELPKRMHQDLKQRLMDTSQPIHVVHFDGHGTFARLCPKCGTPNFSHELSCGKADNNGKQCGASLANAPARGYLLFETDTGEAKFIDTTKFLEGIQRSEVRLVVLSSCHSARVRGADLLLAGVGPGLILAVVPAVVAMQFSISDQDAIKFNHEFYRALAQGDSLPNAVYRGRLMLAEPARWSPVLYLRSKDHQIHLCPPK